MIKIALKYDPQTKEPAIRSLERVSRPGLRQYASPVEFKRVKNGLGIAIVSTSKGVMTDKDAKAQNVGGEVLLSHLLRRECLRKRREENRENEWNPFYLELHFKKDLYIFKFSN